MVDEPDAERMRLTNMPDLPAFQDDQWHCPRCGMTLTHAKSVRAALSLTWGGRGLLVAVSMLLNVVLFGWLAAQYMSDVYFRLYVDQFLAANSTYLDLTLGVGGAVVGYLLLKSRRKASLWVSHPAVTGASSAPISEK